jgi:myo-inositol-1-phosphate synthase
VTITDEDIISNYSYNNTFVKVTDSGVEITPDQKQITFKTQRKVKKTGVMIVGIGGNNGTTFVGGIIANREKIEWGTRRGPQPANYNGSITQSTTVRMGTRVDKNGYGKDFYMKMGDIVPTLDPNSIALAGWDISSMNLADALTRAEVYDYSLQEQLKPFMKDMLPLPAPYYADFIAPNQKARADNILPGANKQAHLDQIRKDIRDFKAKNNLEQVIVLWSANTERFAQIVPGVNDTAENVLNSIKSSAKEIAPSTIFAVAAILEGVPFLNGSPQNTFTPGVFELAEQKTSFVGGSDFKSGQTKMKSVLMDFLVRSGFKVESILSFNALGNNDGKNLDNRAQFLSKAASKTNVIDDVCEAAHTLYKPGEKPAHVVDIKYCQPLGDDKEALDRVVSEIFMGGKNTLVISNTCRDSLLACGILVDLVVLTELFTRIQYKSVDMEQFKNLNSVLSLLSFFWKAPEVPAGRPVINALFPQLSAISNTLRALVGLPPENHMRLEDRI